MFLLNSDDLASEPKYDPYAEGVKCTSALSGWTVFQDDQAQNARTVATCITEQEKTTVTSFTPNWEAESHRTPLITYLRRLFDCTLTQLQVHLTNVEKRIEILRHLRTYCLVFTTHLKPYRRNFRVRCDDISVQNANFVQALNGYLGINVRQFYYIKHGVRLWHSYLPCMIEHGGGSHRSFYPLECLSVGKRLNRTVKFLLLHSKLFLCVNLLFNVGNGLQTIWR